MKKLGWFVLGPMVLVLALASVQVSGQSGFSNASLSGTYALHFSGSDGDLLNFSVTTLNQAKPFNFSCCGPIPPPSLSGNFTKFPYSLPVTLPSAGAASFVADGNGNITSGNGFFFRQSVNFVVFPNITILSAQPAGPSSVQYNYGFNGGPIVSPFSVGMAVTIGGFPTAGLNGTFVVTASDLNSFVVNNPNPPQVIEGAAGVNISGWVIQDHSCNFTLTGSYSVNPDGTGTMNLTPTGSCITASNVTFNLLLAKKGVGGVFYTTPSPSQPPGITFGSFATGSFTKQ
jgi:hypothetical protein